MGRTNSPQGGGNMQPTSRVFETLVLLVSCVADQWSPSVLDVGPNSRFYWRVCAGLFCIKKTKMAGVTFVTFVYIAIHSPCSETCSQCDL